MMRRFFLEGVRDAERRLGRLTAGAPADEPQVVRVITSSRAIRVGERILGVIAGAVESSALMAVARATAERCRRLAPSAQRLAAGVVLLTAAAVHIGMVIAQGVPTGWLWTILPGIAVAVGGLLLAASGSPGIGQAPQP